MTTDQFRPPPGVAWVYWDVQCARDNCTEHVRSYVSRADAETRALAGGYQRGERDGWLCKRHGEVKE